jgi:mycoredoxin
MITFYGADWCGDCRRSKRLLESLGVEYSLIDAENEPGAIEKVLEYNQGKQAIPVIVFPDGSHLTEPSDPQLREKLRELNLIKAE